jgi:hypothetical protein
MVSIKDGFYGHIGKKIKPEGFFADEYHPTSLGHRIMTDCLMQAVADVAEAEPDEPQDIDVKPVYGTSFKGLKTIFGDTETTEYTVERGGFPGSDSGSYRNGPVGQVCGKNFFHNTKDPAEPLKVTGVFRKCLVAWKASGDAAFGAAEILIDGEVKMTVQGGEGKWGQSEVVLVLDEALTGLDEAAAENCLKLIDEIARDKTVVMVGGGNSAFVESALLVGIVKKLIILQDLPKFTADQKLQDQVLSKGDVETHVGTKVLAYEVSEDGVLTGVTYEEAGQRRTVACDGVFLAVGLVPENTAFGEWAQLDERGYFIPENICHTKTPGIYVAGDCCQKTLRQVTTACSDGAYAAISACDYLNDH